MADNATIERARLRASELMRLGLVEAAEAACREWAELAPEDRGAWQHLGLLALTRGAPAEAEHALCRALALNDQSAAVLSHLAVALQRQGRPKEAESFARQAVTLDASNAAHWGNLGACLFDQRRWADASQAFGQAVSLEPGNAGCWSNLGAAEQQLGRFRSAQQALERSLAIQPGQPSVLVDYASVLTKLGQPARALEILQRVLVSYPQAAQAWLAAGNAYQLLDRSGDAIAALRRAYELAPQQFEVRHNLALVLSQRFFLSEAEDLARLNVAEHPDSSEAWWLLGVILEKLLRRDEATQALERSNQLAPSSEHHRALLMSSQYVDDVSPESLLAAHQRWNAAYAEALLLPRLLPAARHFGEKPLRVGFVSHDFGIHAMSFLALRAIERLDRSQCHVTCYSDRLYEDAYAARFRAAANEWRTTIGLTSEELADQIRRDEIGVLVDLMGHAGSRLLAFASKPATVQITWAGYVGTTGMKAIDFLLADRFHVRPGEEGYYVEQVLRMPNGYACYGPPDDAPPVGPLPAHTSGRVTFGSFNNPAKYSHRILDAWARVLRLVPDSHLMLKYHGLGDARLQDRIRQAFAERGISPERILLEGQSPHFELLASYNRVDLALDTQPYSGGVTTCEALWLGVPVITWPGRTFAGRHAVSHLTNAGYPQFIAADVDAYVELAVEWANRLDELAVIRAEMRERVRQSPLCDAPRFAKDFLAVLREAYDRARKTLYFSIAE